MKVLLIEDEKKVSDGIRTILEKDGYQLDVAADGQSGLDAILSNVYDLVLLDIILPKMDGLDVLKYARKEGINVPVIILTAKSSVDDKINGLDGGADDYLTKPFDAGELLARVRARIRSKSRYSREGLTVGDLKLEPTTYKLYGKERSVKLSRKEYQLLEYLMINNGKICTRDMIISRVWGSDSEADDNNLEVYISFVRKKMRFVETDVALYTTKGVGYSIEVERDVV